MDPGVEEEPANPTLRRLQGRWLTNGGGMGLVEGTKVLWNSSETASRVSSEPKIAIFLEGDARYTGALHWEKEMIYWNDGDKWCRQT